MAKPKVRPVYSNPGVAPLTLLVEHHWSGNFKTTNTTVENYKTIISTLDFFAVGSPVDLSVAAIGLKRLLPQERFVFLDTVMREVLCALKPADKMLQSREFSIVNDYQVVNEPLQTMHNIRTETKFSEFC